MKIELDHFFVLTEPGAPAGELLVSLGIEESFSRDHEGQGTSNRRFPVSNSMLELLWVRDVNEAESGPAKNLLLPARAKNKDASPFGLIFTRKTNAGSSVPFVGWDYQPDYFEPPMAFHVGDNSNVLNEPLCIYVPFVEPVVRKEDAGKFGSISHVRVTVPSTDMSDTLKTVKTAAGLEVVTGEEHLIEVHYNGGENGLSKDLRPSLPMIVFW